VIMVVDQLQLAEAIEPRSETKRETARSYVQ
jgi:hypothetical protein